MALQDITKKIIDDTYTRVKEIEKATKTDVATLFAQSEKTQKENEHTRDVEISAKLTQKEYTVLSRARRDARQMISKEKRALIDSVIVDAVAQIVDAKDAAYTQFLKGMMMRVTENVDVQKVLAPHARVDITQKTLKELGSFVEIVGDDNIDAGVILIGNEVDYDLTLARRVADLHAELELIIVKKLFV